MKRIIILLIITSSFIYCKTNEENKKTNKSQYKSSVKYAKGFDIVFEDGVKKLIIKRVFQKSNKTISFNLTTANNLTKNEIKVPIERMVVTSTTHIPMLELLAKENTIVGFPHTKYISSKRIRALIDNGTIQELGAEQDINTEKLIAIEPELVVGVSLNPNNKLYANIKKLGIPVIYNGDWLEETPLGRAEWIKFFGVLTGKEQKADSIFKTIEMEYLAAMKLAKSAKNKKTVMAGSMFKDVWNIPAGESFKAQFFKDANLNYLWKDTKGTGSLPLSFEAVLDKAQYADLWLGCGLYEKKEQLLAGNKHYTNFDAFANDNIYTIAKNKGATGGLKYFEFAPIQPNLVLKDLIKISQPNLLPDYELTFFRKLEK